MKNAITRHCNLKERSPLKKMEESNKSINHIKTSNAYDTEKKIL